MLGNPNSPEWVNPNELCREPLGFAPRVTVLIALIAFAAGCAVKAAPPLPPTLKYPEFVYPAPLPAADREAMGIDRGWRFLQNDDLSNAEREFAAAVKTAPASAAAKTGEGYVFLARHDYMRALDHFENALRGVAAYAPALVGKGLTLLSLNRDTDARAAFEAAVKADPSLTNLSARIDVLKFREIQNLIAAARNAMNAGRLDEARMAYQRAIAATPDSAVLYRELGVVERRSGNAAGALEQFNHAFMLDPADAISLAQVGELLEERGDFAGAQTAFRNAHDVDPFSGYDRKADAAAARAREAGLPAEYRSLPSAPQISRGDLAALIGIRFEDILRQAPRTAGVITDTAGHWAALWIAEVAAAAVMPAFDNHTFQPRAQVRRVDLAEAANALLRIVARTRPAVQARIAARPTIPDVSPSHLNYPAIAAAVSAGVLPLDGGRFDTERPVSGADAIAALDRLRALVSGGV
jgi:tetratricopeptide (TPR) repeat protein